VLLHECVLATYFNFCVIYDWECQQKFDPNVKVVPYVSPNSLAMNPFFNNY